MQDGTKTEGKVRAMIAEGAPSEEVLKVPEVARVLRTDVRSVYALVSTGTLRSVRVGPKGGGIRVPRSALSEFLGQRDAQ